MLPWARVHNPNSILIGSAVFAQLTSVSSACPSPQNCPFSSGIWTPANTWFLGSNWLSIPNNISPPPSKLSHSMGNLDPHLIYHRMTGTLSASEGGCWLKIVRSKESLGSSKTISTFRGWVKFIGQCRITHWRVTMQGHSDLFRKQFFIKCKKKRLSSKF